MTPFRQYSFPATGIRSLCWRKDDLIDWVGGGRTFALDGTEQRASVRYAYRFDAATASRDGRFAVIYERLGTKGLVLKDGKILREIDRSFYQANAYEIRSPCSMNRVDSYCSRIAPETTLASRLRTRRRGNRLPYRMNVSHAISSTHVSRPAREESDY
jgi:hypothetical protein